MTPEPNEAGTPQNPSSLRSDSDLVSQTPSRPFLCGATWFFLFWEGGCICGVSTYGPDDYAVKANAMVTA